jgi:uncharacterized membrane protein
MVEPSSNQAPDPGIAVIGNEEQYGSLEKGMNGDYPFVFSELLREAWAKTDGNKMVLNVAGSICFIVALVFGAISGALQYQDMAGTQSLGLSLLDVAVTLVYYAIAGCTGAGLFVIGTKLAMERSAKPGEVFRYISRAGIVLVTYILMIILVTLGLLLLILPGIYLAVGYIMALTLVVEKDLSPWQALEASRKAIHHQWFGVFGLMLVMSMITVLSLLTFGIALIWFYPMFILCFGILYRDMFGLEPNTLED